MLIKATYPIEIIDDILKRPDALDTYLGEEVNCYLSKKLTELTEPTLLKINLRKANPIDYLFTKTAFGNFYKTIISSDKFDCLFFINKSQTRNLFWGLLACLDGNIHRTGDYETNFKTDNNIKISVTNDEIKFIGILNKSEEEILQFINLKGIVEDDEIHSTFSNNTSHEKIADSIRNLKNKKFLYSDESSIPNKIYSINSKIT